MFFFRERHSLAILGRLTGHQHHSHVTLCSLPVTGRIDLFISCVPTALIHALLLGTCFFRRTNVPQVLHPSQCRWPQGFVFEMSLGAQDDLRNHNWSKTIFSSLYCLTDQLDSVVDDDTHTHTFLHSPIYNTRQKLLIHCIFITPPDTDLLTRTTV